MKKLSDEQVLHLRIRASKGESDIDLASAYGIALGAVSAIRTGARRSDVGGPITRRRRDVTTTRLLRERIAKRLKAGQTYARIAEELGCSISQVQRVAHPIADVHALRVEVERLRELVERVLTGGA